MDIDSLVIEAKKGDESALSELFEALEIKKKILKKYRLSREDTEDLVQEIKEMIYLSLANYDENIAPFLSYALVIIKRTIKHRIDEIYDFNRHLKTCQDEELLDFSVECLEYDEMLDYLKKHLSNLEIQIILYIVSYGYSAKFIASKFNIKPKKVYKTMEKFKKVANNMREGFL